MTEIVILDAFLANPGDLDWSGLEMLGTVTVYDRSSNQDILPRSKSADVILTNKCVLDQKILSQLPKLKYIGLLATGYNNIDVQYANSMGVSVCNAVGYSTPSVSQHVFSLLLELTNHVGVHNRRVHSGGWSNSKDWCFWDKPIMELYGKTLGIYGLGNIGSAVAKIGLAFGMKVIATRKNKDKLGPDGIELVSDTTLLKESDFLSLHAALSNENKHFINASTLQQMKKSAYLINTSRGDLVHEEDLKNALLANIISGAALDVLAKEPPVSDHPFYGIPNCILTPHNAWASKESRRRLINIVTQNVKNFLEGKEIQRILE